MNGLENIRWETWEFEHKERSSDWFWAMGIISAALAIVAAAFGNFLFGLLIIIAAAAIMVINYHGPRHLSVELSSKGVRVGKELYHFSNLTAFALDEDEEPVRLVLHVNRIVFPHVKVDIAEEINPELVRKFLSLYLKEEEHHPTLSEALTHFFGF